jgi:hypothetical protein
MGVCQQAIHNSNCYLNTVFKHWPHNTCNGTPHPYLHTQMAAAYKREMAHKHSVLEYAGQTVLLTRPMCSRVAVDPPTPLNRAVLCAIDNMRSTKHAAFIETKQYSTVLLCSLVVLTVYDQPSDCDDHIHYAMQSTVDVIIGIVGMICTHGQAKASSLARPQLLSETEVSDCLPWPPVTVWTIRERSSQNVS